jgi:hypothetical protein
MTSQLKLGEHLKELGLNRVESQVEHDEWLGLARRFAVRYCARTGSVSAVEVRDWAERTGNVPEDPLAYSALFRGKEWVNLSAKTGQRTKSRHAGGHARMVDRWRYESSIY